MYELLARTRAPTIDHPRMKEMISQYKLDVGRAALKMHFKFGSCRVGCDGPRALKEMGMLQWHNNIVLNDNGFWMKPAANMKHMQHR